MGKIFNNILETIGNTPLVRLNKITTEIPATVLAKVETTNPGNSVKDRMALKMIEDAEIRGDIKPGGTIIECTSGNTGMGIAIASVVKGYKCIFTTTDKQSKEKIDILRAIGAEVIVCPTNVEPKDPRSYYSVAERLSKEIPNSYWCNQYDNLSNRVAHYESTGPEIWEQTNGKITHFVVGVGTGGTISGVGKFLKEKNPAIKIWGIDTYGSVFKKYHETGIFDPEEIYPYVTEGIGEDILPLNVDFKVIDHFEKVADKDAAIGTRSLARLEGIFVGNSAGAAIMGVKQMAASLTKDDLVVVLFHDHGSRYVGKMFNDDWMRERGFLEDEITVKEIIAKKRNKHLYSLDSKQSAKDALKFMKEKDISQLPVIDSNQKIIGAVTESIILSTLLENPIENSDKMLIEIMTNALPEVDESMTVKILSHYFTDKTTAVIAVDKAGTRHIITKYDVVQTLG
jgi:cystathionine beta-synthase